MRTKNRILVSFIATFLLLTSCVKDLLDQQSVNELGSAAFFKTEADAESALMGLYANVKPLFNFDYYFDGQSEFVRVSGTSTSSGTFTAGSAYNSGNFNPSGYGSSFDQMYRYLFAGVNRANYVIDNVTLMLPQYPNSTASLEAIIGEAKILRALVYFRLISMWGDVPYIDKVVQDNSEVANISRSPISKIRGLILEDLGYAIEKVPSAPPKPDRLTKPAALALRGKVNLYWASWNKFGWPELDTFSPSATEAAEAYKAAAADFKSVIEDFGLTLFRNGEPGEIDELGKAEKLPNYYYLFLPIANGDSEFLISFTHGGPGTNLSERLMRDFGGRTMENGQLFLHPLFWLADRYQSTITGDFAEPLIGMNPNTNPEARTTPNSAVNPQSYANRDYRMKATILWDYEMIQGASGLVSTGYHPFLFQRWNSPIIIDGVQYTTYNTDRNNSGYVFRKFLRNYAGQSREQGDYNWPVMRLADVYLMYAEASNEAYGPQADAIAWVNKVRHRGNLPPLAAEKTANRDAFFQAIEQERIVELIGEGHRSFDLRRWRALERVWGPPYGPGRWPTNTFGSNVNPIFYQNANERTYQQAYIFRIPESERNRNPNLTQNTPYL